MGLDGPRAMRYLHKVRLVGLALIGLAACGTAAPSAVTTGPHLRIPPGAPAKGGVVRIEVNRAITGIALFAHTWLHVDDDQSEHLTITADGRFDWKIERPSSGTCQIAGTVTLIEGPVLAFQWMMTTNNCNSSYEGRTSNDWIVQHDRMHLALVDAEFHTDPVTYDLISGREGAQPGTVTPPPADSSAP
jgi:hypothetical protein